MNDFIDKNLIDSSYKFALKIVKLTQTIQNEKKEYMLSKQLLRCGTAIGAQLTEAKFYETKPEVIEKLKHALSDVYKTNYWITLILTTNDINQAQYNSVIADCKALHSGLKRTMEVLGGDA